MEANIKPGDVVRVTDKAIRQCRQYFGRQAKWTARERTRRYDVLNVIEDKQNDVFIVEIKRQGKPNSEIEQVASCHLEIIIT